jgi:hypothetical protein
MSRQEVTLDFTQILSQFFNRAANEGHTLLFTDW